MEASLKPQAPRRERTETRRRTQKLSKSCGSTDLAELEAAAASEEASLAVLAASANAAVKQTPALNSEVSTISTFDESYQYVNDGQLLVPDGTRALALFSYSSECPTDLHFPEGAVIKIIRRYSNGWWEGELDGVIGDFPCNYVAEIDDNDDDGDSADTQRVREAQAAAQQSTFIPQLSGFTDRGSRIRALPVKQGWLVKKGHRRRNWKVRFFVLEADRITYYANQGDIKAKGCIPLSQSTLVKVAPEMKRSNCFMISTDVKPFIYYVTAPSGEEMVEWMNAITSTKAQLTQ